MKMPLYAIAIMMFMLASCSTRTPVSQLENKEAAVPAAFNLSGSGLKVITSFINKKLGTTSTLYGNALALTDATNGQAGTRPGERFTLVTWQQQEDEHWFGARIPGKLQAVETLETALAGHATKVTYHQFKGKAMQTTQDTLHNAERINLILAQKPAVMP